MKYKPKDTTDEEWQEAWERSAWVLQPLADVLKDMAKGLDVIKADDFAVPNHYARIVAQQMKKQTLEQVLSLLPSTVEK